MKTSELTGAALDWAVAKCEGIDFTEGGVFHELNNFIGRRSVAGNANWSTNWAQGGPIIEREMIQLTPHCMVNPLHGWAAAFRSFDEDDDVCALHRMRGKTPLIAAMRCYVASKLGNEIDVPKELQ